MSEGPRPDHARTPGWAWAVLVVVLVFDVWLRAHTFGPIVRERLGLSLWPVTGLEGEPLDCDESAYAYIGRRLVRGDVLYRDLTENKPPLGYWLYGLAVSLGGANELTIRLMPIPMVLATIVLVWRIGMRASGPLAACLAAATYALVSTDPYVFGNGANLEHAINLFAVLGLALLVRRSEVADTSTSLGIAAAGACLGAASLVKQVAALHVLVFGVILLVGATREARARALADRLRDALALGLGFALAWALAVSVLTLQGAGPEAYEDIVRYGGALATDTPPDAHAPPFLERWLTGNADPRGELPPPFGKTDYLVWWGTGTWPLWLAAIPALGWLMRGGPSRRLIAVWTLSAWVQVALPRLFWPHYYLLPLPGIALAVGIATTDAARHARAGGSLWAILAVVMGLGAIGSTAALQAKHYLVVAPQELTVRFKGGAQWVNLRRLGREIAARTRGWTDPRLFVWGWQSPLYLYGELDGVTPHFFADPLLKHYAGSDHPLIRPRIERIERDLRARPPVLVFAGDPPFPALRAILLARYRPARLAIDGKPLGLTPDGRGLWVRRDVAEKFEAPPSRRATRQADSRSSYFTIR